jgi:triosephosphate isomerase (TIM)
MKKPLIVANWKRYIEKKDEAVAAAKAIARSKAAALADIVVCPSFVHLDAVGKALQGKGVALGAQTLSFADGPMHTGEVSAAMLSDLKAKYVIVGHSERRAMGESNEAVRSLVSEALSAKLYPILCVGEPSRDPSGAHYDALTAQLRESLGTLLPAEAKRLVIAYEPVWAIGKRAEDAIGVQALEETVLYIRKVLAETIGRAAALATPILYGGSVELENAEALMGAGVAGFLVGHASVDPKSLFSIANAAHGAPKR